MLLRLLPLSAALAAAAFAAPAAAQQASGSYPSRGITCRDHLAVIDSYLDERGSTTGTDISGGYARATEACNTGKNITALNEIEDLRVALGIPADEMNRRVASQQTTVQQTAINQFSCEQHLAVIDDWLLKHREAASVGQNPQRVTIEDTHAKAIDDCRAGRDAEAFSKIAWNRRLLGMPLGDQYAVDAGNVVAYLNMSDDLGYVPTRTANSRAAVATTNSDMIDYSSGKRVAIQTMGAPVASSTTTTTTTAPSTAMVTPSGTYVVPQGQVATTTTTVAPLADDPQLERDWWQ